MSKCTCVLRLEKCMETYCILQKDPEIMKHMDTTDGLLKAGFSKEVIDSCFYLIEILEMKDS